MTTREFMSYLRRLDVQLWAEGGRLHINSPNGVLTPPLHAELAERKEEILAIVHSTRVAAPFTGSQIQPMPRPICVPRGGSGSRLRARRRGNPGPRGRPEGPRAGPDP